MRDGRYHWSGFALWWRFALLYFIGKFSIRFALVPSHWRAEPELWGIPGFNMPIAGSAASTAPIIATLMVLITYRQRRRFNAVAPRVPVAEGAGDVTSRSRGAEA